MFLVFLFLAKIALQGGHQRRTVGQYIYRIHVRLANQSYFVTVHII